MEKSLCRGVKSQGHGEKSLDGGVNFQGGGVFGPWWWSKVPGWQSKDPRRLWCKKSRVG